MAKSHQGYVKQTTLLTAVLIALGFGFMSGVIWSAYKTGAGSGSGSDPAHNHDNEPDRAGVEKMLAALEEQVAQQPDNVEVLTQLAHLYFDHDRPEKAIKAYQKVLTLDPGNANIMTDLGVMYRRSGEAEKALQTFEQAIAADPKHETARFNRGVVLMHDLKKNEEAIAAWKALADINPLFTAPNGMSLDELIKHYGDGH